MGQLTEKQEQVFDRAKQMLEGEEWYMGVCMDNFPSDQEIERNGIEESAQSVYCETASWDADCIM